MTAEVSQAVLQIVESVRMAGMVERVSRQSNVL